MNNRLLRATRENLHAWVAKSKITTVHLDQRMEVVMLALADMCEAMATDEPEVVDVEIVEEESKK